MLTLLEREIAAVDMTMKTMSDEIELLRRDLVKTKENYARSMQNRQMELRTAQHKILLVLSADNLAQSYRRLRYLREYADWQKEEAGRIVDKQNEIARRKAELEKTRDDKLRLLSQRAQESKTLEAEKNLQQREVALLNKKRKALQTQLQQKKKEAEALNRQIESLISEDIENSEKRLPDAPSATPPTASSYRMTDADLHLSTDFAANKGRLPYPLTGKCVIVSSFGEHQHRELTYVRTNNDGIDLRTTAGAEACAVFKGVVTRVFIMPGYNQNVIVRHGNYLTVYSNLSTVYVKAGDVVETRQPIGKIFTDTEKGHETILHFQIRKERTKLNPVTWIRR